MIESKRKTVLCNNFPLGQCRFGDNCRYYSMSSIGLCLAWEVVSRLPCRWLFNGPFSDHGLPSRALCLPCAWIVSFQLCARRRGARHARPATSKTPCRTRRASWRPVATGTELTVRCGAGRPAAHLAIS
jgi:hypothetical protein